MAKQKSNKLPTCYVLFSGGLDSRLALKIMQEQSSDIFSDKPYSQEKQSTSAKKNDEDLTHNPKFKIICLYYHLPFLKDTRKEIEEFCKQQKTEFKILDYSQGKLFGGYMKIIHKPKFGYGVGINPCIDCHLFIITETKKMMKNQDFIATGEVLGERPMSQHRKALDEIENESGLKGRILRPLSAKLLEGTIPEKEKLVNRDRLLDINGRSRKRQIELAEKYKISYPHPAGGCLLCEKVFAERLRNLFKRKEANKIQPRDILLLKVGRHFIFDGFHIIVGRNQEENNTLERLADKKSEKIFTLKSLPGPTVLLQGKITSVSKEKAKDFLFKYSKEKDEIFEK